MKLANKQWQAIEQIISYEPKNPHKRGRPSLDKREVVNAILWVLGNNARWKQLPDNFPQYQTCRNYFYAWLKAGVIKKIFQILTEDFPPQERMPLEDFSNRNKKNISAIFNKIQVHPSLSQPSIFEKTTPKAGENTRHLYFNSIK